MTSLFERSLLPGSSLGQGSREPCAALSALPRDGHSFGNPLSSSLGCSCDRDSHSAECSRSSWPQAAPSLGNGSSGEWWSLPSRCQVSARDGPWGRTQPSSSGCPGTPPAQERLCLQGGCGSTHQPWSLLPPPSSLTSHTQTHGMFHKEKIWHVYREKFQEVLI